MHEITADQVNRSFEGNEGESVVAKSDYPGRRSRNTGNRDGTAKAEFVQTKALDCPRRADKERFVHSGIGHHHAAARGGKLPSRISRRRLNDMAIVRVDQTGTGVEVNSCSKLGKSIFIVVRQHDSA